MYLMASTRPAGLHQAQLTQAQLTRAQLTRAQLTRAQLKRAQQLHGRRIRLPARPAAAAQARRHVAAAIRDWDIPVDQDVAMLLTSELVTNAIRHEPGESVTVRVSCSCSRLRVAVLDTSAQLPLVVHAAADEEAGRGLMLVATLASVWGCYRTDAGKAVYFVLAPEVPSS